MRILKKELENKIVNNDKLLKYGFCLIDNA